MARNLTPSGGERPVRLATPRVLGLVTSETNNSSVKRLKDATGPPVASAPPRPDTTQLPVSGGPLPDVERQRRIAEAAYLIAEQEGFPAEREIEHWLQAEATIDQAMAKSKRG